MSQKSLVATPNLLYVQLLRFDDFQNPKIETKVTPENILVLPNKDKYKLISIGNHLGAFINNGHYQALVKIGSKWIMADDNNIQKTNLLYEITGNNYIFVYKKFSTIIPFVATTYWEEVLEDQPIPAGLHVQLDTQTGGKMAKLLEKTNSTDGNHKQNSFERDNGNYDYEQEQKSSHTYCSRRMKRTK